MFEAVGLEYYDDFFASWERLIEPGGADADDYDE